MTTSNIFLTKVKAIQKIAKNTLEQFNITSPPVNPKKIAKKLGKLYNFKDNTEKGFTQYIDNVYKIYINVGFKNMCTWTYSHEIGHIQLNHFTEYDEFLSTEEGHKTLDMQANIFASELLMPKEWIEKYVELYPPTTKSNLAKLKNIFNVSWDSLMNRLDTLCIQSKEVSENLFKTSSKLDIQTNVKLKSTPKDITFTSFHSNVIKVKFKKNKELTTMNSKYLHIETDTNGRFTKCPQCGNESISQEAEFCKICGLYLYNTCSINSKQHDEPCDHITSGDARYCEYCGNETILLKKGMLFSFEEIKEEDISIEECIDFKNIETCTEQSFSVADEDIPF